MVSATQPPDQQQNPWVPPGAEPIVFDDFRGGLNTNASRPGVEETQMFWCDGFMPIGKNFLRTMYGIAPSIFNVATYTGSSYIVWFDFANIASRAICVVLTSDGSLFQIDMQTTTVTLMAGPGTILNPGPQSIGMTQWGSQLVILISNQTNGYFYWDGSLFYTPGMMGPDGNTVPTGISGSSIEVYQGHIWAGNGATINFTAPGSYSDFTTAHGGGAITSTDSFLRVGFTALVSTNGFLYLIADSSINYISGVQTSGSPPTTTFTNQNADPEIGTPWPNTVDVFSRNIVFANPFGAHISYGGAVNKTSAMLDGVYNTVANFGTPSASKSTMFGRKVWILLLPIIDPLSGQQVNKLFIWDGKIWWSSSQEVPLTYVQHQEINSVLTAYGTDGKNLYPLFRNPSIGFQKTVQSKLWERPIGYEMTKATSRLWGLAQYYSPLSPVLTISIDNETGQSPQPISVGPLLMPWQNNVGGPIVWTNNLGQPLNWFIAGGGLVVFPPEAVGQQGALTGLTVQTNAADMALVSLKIRNEVVGYRG